jgi:hypothetical protein
MRGEQKKERKTASFVDIFPIYIMGSCAESERRLRQGVGELLRADAKREACALGTGTKS